MPRILELNCLVLGEPRSRIFVVEIAGTKSVSALKDAIKEKRKPALDHISADTLIMWKVSFPADQEDLEENLGNLADKNSLPSVKRLSSLFSDQPADEYLHIVVQRPPTGEHKYHSALVALPDF